VKNHYVKETKKGRCLSGDPQLINKKKKPRKAATKLKAFPGGQGSYTYKNDKVYRLPSISKCLEHEILPRSSLMLKQICEIASHN
jgi:hypothetical protein